MNVILIASIVWDAVRRERVYREIGRNTERIGREDAPDPAAQEAHDTETRVMSWVDDLLRAGGDDAVAFWHGYVSAEAEDPLAQLRSELAAAQAREQACMERIKDALDCLPRALDGSRPFSLDQRAEVMLAIEALRAALAAAGGEGQG